MGTSPSEFRINDELLKLESGNHEGHEGSTKDHEDQSLRLFSSWSFVLPSCTSWFSDFRISSFVIDSDSDFGFRKCVVPRDTPLWMTRGKPGRGLMRGCS